MSRKKSEPNRLNFTKAAIANLPSPTTGRVVYHDTGCDNLTLVVSATSRTFYWYGRSGGRPARLCVGNVTRTSVDDARKKVRRLSSARDDGRDPKAERAARKEEATLSELWTAYLEHHAKPKKRTWKDDERQYNKYLAEFRHKRLSALTQSMIAAWHSRMGKKYGHTQANRTKSLLSAMYSKGSRAVGYDGANPCKGVASFPEQSRERFLLPTEMSAFFSALAKESVFWQQFFAVTLFTGSRRGNVASMEWREIDLDNAAWHLPGAKTKNKKATPIGLCEPVVAILRARQAERGDNEYVFPGMVSKGNKHVVNPTHCWERIRAASGLRDLRMHDLRRSMGSWLAAAGVNLPIIGKALGHVDLRSTQVYSRLQLDPVREAVSASAERMMKTAKVEILSGKIKNCG
jgi:integrase